MDKAEEGSAFFDDQTEPTEAIKASQDVAQEAVNSLADAGLIMPWKINLKQGEKVVPVEGLFRIDEAALNISMV